MDVEGACMDDLFDSRGCLLGSVNVEFDATTIAADAGRKGRESVTLADTRIERNETGHQLKMLPNAVGFWRRKRKVPETEAPFDSQGGDYSFLCLNWVCAK